MGLKADFVLSFELLEAARWAEYLKEGGVLLTNTQKVNPMPVITGAAEYPKALEKKLAALPIRLDAMDALGLALRAGSARAVNLVLLGRLSRYFHFTDEQWHDAIEKSVPAKFLELNKKPLRSARISISENPWNGIIRRKSNAPAGSRSGHGRTSGSSVRCVMCVWTMCPITAQRWRRTLRRTISEAGTIFTSCRF